MAGPVSFVTTAFIGGEISQSAQGRMDLPAYRMSMNVCFNGIPMEEGAWQRRPGTLHVAPMRGSATGKIIKFAFEESYPYQMVFSDGFLRFTTGPALVMTNDQQAISAISTANPAVVQTAKAHGWSTGNVVTFNSLGTNNPLLQGRQFSITVVDSTHFSLQDALTGANINGSTLGAFVSGNVTRILDIATTYTAGSWANLRSVQAETRTVLLNGAQPQVLQVASLPTSSQFATFTLGPANFIDGPYLDPIENSVVSSSALNGVVTLTFSFAAWISSKAYNVGDFVSYSDGFNYKSTAALNQNNTPSGSSAFWTRVNGGAAVNNGQGFQSSDIGRLIRLYSEPALWSASSNYNIGDVVAYPDGSGGSSYWTATTAITGGTAGTQPGTTTKWALNATGAQWTWAQITGVSGSGLINPATAIGNMTAGGGLSAAFDGTNLKAFAGSAAFLTNIQTYPVWSSTNWAVNSVVQDINHDIWVAQYTIIATQPYAFWTSSITYVTGQIVYYNGFVYQANTNILAQKTPPDINSDWTLIYAYYPYTPGAPVWVKIGTLPSPTEDVYIGQNYGGGGVTAIQSATLYPTTDAGIANAPVVSQTITVNLRGSNSAPSSPSNGTLLGTATVANTVSPVTIVSSDQVSTWQYVWFEIVTVYSQPLPDNGSHIYPVGIGVAQAQFYSPNVNNGSVVQAQIRGNPLIYNVTIRTWQAGLYSNTTGFPTCGAYHEGRIWLGGVVSNRFDASVSNGLVGTELDFTPTAPDGTVTDANSISYICDGEDSNQILWMTPDQQGVLFGSQAGEWLISASSAGAMSPTNIKAVRVTKIGCANAEPRRAEHTLLLIQKYGRKIMEYFADVYSGKFSAPNLSERAKHMTVNGMAEISYQQELTPTIWARRNDGALIGATYKRDTLTTSQGPNIIGWHRHALGSGRLVESISVGPSKGGNLDSLSLLTNDPGTGVRHIEMMTDLLDEGFALTSCCFLDDAIVPSSFVINAQTAQAPFCSITLNGLWQHNGKLVTAFVAGLDCGDWTVSNGSITIPFGDGVSGGTGNGLFTLALVNSFTTLPAYIGFTYVSQGQLVRPVTAADTGTQAGPGFAKLGRQHRAAAMLYGCVNGSISFGTDFNTLYPAKLLQPSGTPYAVNQLWSGIWRDSINSPYDFDNMISWQISRPLPAIVIAIGGFDAKADA